MDGERNGNNLGREERMIWTNFKVCQKQNEATLCQEGGLKELDLGLGDLKEVAKEAPQGRNSRRSNQRKASRIVSRGRGRWKV